MAKRYAAVNVLSVADRASGQRFREHVERQMNRVRGAWVIGLAANDGAEVGLTENCKVDALGLGLLEYRP